MTKEKRHKRRDSPERESKVKIKQEKESPVRPHKTRRSRSRSNGNSSPQRTSRYLYIIRFYYNLLLEQCFFRHYDGFENKTDLYFLNSSERETAPLVEEGHLPPAERADLPGTEGVAVPIVLLKSESNGWLCPRLLIMAFCDKLSKMAVMDA